MDGVGLIPVRLVGADFQFVEKVSLVGTDLPNTRAAELAFTFPQAKSAGDRSCLEVRLDTKVFREGEYLIRLTQMNGKSHDLPLTVHPPNPVLDDLPLRANLGAANQVILLRGTGLDRIEKISGERMTWTLAQPAHLREIKGVEQREANLTLDKTLRKGDLLDVSLQIAGIHQPLVVRGAMEVVGPRPTIVGVDRSFPPELSVELRGNEIPAGFPISFALRTKNLSSSPTLELDCGQEDSSPALLLQPGESRDGAKLDLAGEGVLFLSLDPGRLGSTGCELKAAVKCNPTGTSEPYLLGRIIRVPQIEKFELTEEKLDNSLYVGLLTGKELQTIDKTGWDAQHGYPVLGIPTPVVGQSDKQTLRVALPWPAPAPRAPIFIWLRGEAEGRATQARF